ncbi:Lsr2 dimerization domain-containing protein [Acrocarpospora catenulata]|uniref:Lsr2 dimerization domain-containing protein n=1 Tax=Acrocarpospora catenulata TaxID=2836182 RepID=UPI001BD9860A|nr:histone-like nucleoid-structuring protein Lsr2 [Acrocarpospora catenulata]
MAEKVILIDDLDQSEGEDVVRREFQLLQRTFAIDLSEVNDRRLRDAVSLIELALERGREVKQATRSRRAAEPQRLRGHTNSDVRKWAAEQGIEVPARGTLPDEVIDKFIAAVQAPEEG